MRAKLAIEHLTSSFLFRLSLTNKELFHSEVLSALFEYNPDFFMDVVSTTAVPVRVEREVRLSKGCTIDVRVDYANGGVFLENKVKDVAQFRQLATYEAEIARRFPNYQRVLLSPLRTSRLPPNWTNLLYDHVITCLRKHSGDPSFARTGLAGFVTPYAEVLEAICSLTKLSQRLVRGDRQFSNLVSFYNAPRFRARNIRFYDAIAKTIFSTLIERWLGSQSATVAFSSSGWNFAGGYFGLAPSSTQGQLGVAFERAGVQLGIQLEGLEFRPFVSGTAVTNAIRDNWLKRAVSFSPRCSVTPAAKLRGKGEYGYGSSFRYWKLKVPPRATVDEVLSGISESMDYLKQEILRSAPWLP